MKIFIGNRTTTSYDFHLCPGENLYNGSKDLNSKYGQLSSLEIDLLNIASGIYATDLAIMRAERENFIRKIEIDIEVVNFHAFDRIKDKLKYALHILSKDNWLLNFTPIDGVKDGEYKWKHEEGAVLLFSGGLDSMAAASDFMENKKNIVLVSHNTHGNRVVDESQKNVHRVLEEFYKNEIKHIRVKVYGRNKGKYSFPEERENTQRTRSFLFLSLAAIVTKRSGFDKIVFMAENGQFAIHLPLNQSRIGPFSTHTADPEFIHIIEEIFKIVLDNPKFEIVNPYLYLTKAEVLAKLPEGLLKKSYLSVTCWMISRIQKHCGYCIPCISRRIALEYNNISFSEYKMDLFNTDLNSLGEDETAKINIIDYLEFITRFQNISPSNKQELLLEFPELMNSSINSELGLQLYNRVSTQSLEVFKKYPKIREIL